MNCQNFFKDFNKLKSESLLIVYKNLLLVEFMDEYTCFENDQNFSSGYFFIYS